MSEFLGRHAVGGAAGGAAVVAEMPNVRGGVLVRRAAAQAVLRIGGMLKSRTRDARIVEIGCGTGQMSLYLARAERLVIGADLTRASLVLGAEAGRRFGVDKAVFVETDLARPGLRRGECDLLESGVVDAKLGLSGGELSDLEHVRDQVG